MKFMSKEFVKFNFILRTMDCNLRNFCTKYIKFLFAKLQKIINN